MIRKLIAALLVGAAVVALDRPDETTRAARDALGTAAEGAIDRAGSVALERCRADPSACLR